jgi:predicted RND superfamily exporter protein
MMDEMADMEREMSDSTRARKGKTNPRVLAGLKELAKRVSKKGKTVSSVKSKSATKQRKKAVSKARKTMNHIDPRSGTSGRARDGR